MQASLSLLSLLVLLSLLLLLAGSHHALGQAYHGNDKHSPVEFALKFSGVIGAGAPKPGVVPQTELKLIGAGLSRTGTKSTKEALEILGYKVFHVEDLMSNDLVPDLNKALQLNSDYFLQLFVNKILALGYNATLDIPGQVLSLRLAKLYPNAKVLFTTRDTPEQWARSFADMVQKSRFIAVRPFTWLADFYWFETVGAEMWKMRIELVMCQSYFPPLIDCIESAKFVELPGQQKRTLEDVYLEWREQVVREIPADRLLEFNVKQGWAPLTRFLQAPDQPGDYPYINEGETLGRIETALHFISIAWSFIAILVVYLGAKFVVRLSALVGL